MKINEILKVENKGRKYKGGGRLYRVEANDKVACLIEDENIPTVLSSYFFSIDFEEVKEESGWANEIHCGDGYFFVSSKGTVGNYTLNDHSFDNLVKYNCNMFSTKEKAEEVAKEQLLYRKMKKFRDENDVYVDWFKDRRLGYCVIFDLAVNKYRCSSSSWRRELNGIYFTTEELAERCLKEVVEPFMGVRNE